MAIQQPKSAAVIDFIFNLFAEQGARDYMGEAVSMTQHMEQSAACAVADGADDRLIVATLLHDIGHFLGEHPIDALARDLDNYHEEVGAHFLARYFPSAVVEPIRLHVAAKRYLCATNTDYYASLSDASVASLQVQGGPMKAVEIRQFEIDPNHAAAVELRRYDDDGKVAGLRIAPVTAYRDLMSSLLV